jgi:hypothetical protein
MGYAGDEIASIDCNAGVAVPVPSVIDARGVLFKQSVLKLSTGLIRLIDMDLLKRRNFKIHGLSEEEQGPYPADDRTPAL